MTYIILKTFSFALNVKPKKKKKTVSMQRTTDIAFNVMMMMIYCMLFTNSY